MSFSINSVIGKSNSLVVMFNRFFNLNHISTEGIEKDESVLNQCSTIVIGTSKLSAISLLEIFLLSLNNLHNLSTSTSCFRTFTFWAVVSTLYNPVLAPKPPPCDARVVANPDESYIRLAWDCSFVISVSITP